MEEAFLKAEQGANIVYLLVRKKRQLPEKKLALGIKPKA